MDSLPVTARIEGRIKSIESRMASLSMELSAMESPRQPLASSFRQTLADMRNQNRENKLAESILPDFSTEESEETLPADIAGFFRTPDMAKRNGQLQVLLNDIRAARDEDVRAWALDKAGFPAPEAERTPNLSEYPESLRGLLEKYWDSYVGQKHANDRLSLIAQKQPKRVVKFEGYSMQAKTAVKYRTLKEVIKMEFPGRGIFITSTMGGQHTSKAHPSGRAVDFVVDDLSRKESKKVEKLAKDLGFRVYNEYIHDSPYKTGDHMHIEI